MLIDEHLAAFRWSERHATEIAAPAAAVYAATRAVTAAEIPLARVLTRVRSLPGRALGRQAPPPATTQPVLDEILRSGFVLLGEEPGREIVVGIVGRFWQACPVHVTLDRPSAFAGFDEPGWAKAAMNFTVEAKGGGRTRLATETRIAATDAASARRFALYWTLVRPGSGLIRWAWLRAVAKRARMRARSMPRLPAIAVTAVAFLAGCGSEGPSPVPQPSVAAGSGWSAAAPMLDARQEVCVAAIGARVYVAGGYRADGSTAATLEVYDTAADRWTMLAPMPDGVNHCAAAAVGARLFVFGGARANGTASGSTFEYDAAANAWSVRAPMPTARAAPMAVAAGTRVYVAGGLPGGRALEAYDTGADTWLSLPPMPTARDHLAGGVVANRILAVGGRPPLTLAVAEVFDVAAGSWSTAAPLPTGRSGHAAAVVRGCLYVMGGEGNPRHPNGVFPQVEVYDPRGNRWDVLPEMPSARHGMGAAVVDDRIWVPGGANVQGFGAVATNHVFTPPADRSCF